MRPIQRPKRHYDEYEIIEKIHRHFFLEKNPKCKNQNGTCVYTQTGCAIGCLITEEDAEVLNKDGGELWAVWDKYPDILNQYFSHQEYPLLNSLQKAHDDSYDDDNLLKSFSLVFKEYGYIVEDDQLRYI